MRRIDAATPEGRAELDSLLAPRGPDAAVEEAVRQALEAVRTRGDEAVAELTERFERARLTPAEFRVPVEERQGAFRRLPARDRAALRAAVAAVEAYARRGRPKDWSMRNPHGAQVGEVFHPLRRVGLWIPGASVPLVSTVVMTATLARAAGVAEIACFTPCDAEGRVAAGTLGVLNLLGLEEVYRIGGVPAVGAMAFGTGTIRPVDKIFGPGNAYVVEAKRQVFGRVGIDLLPGPSEIAVIADRTARADWVAADLLAQAEHGSGRERVFLISIGPGLADAVESELNRQVAALEPRPAVRATVEAAVAIEVDQPARAAEVANQLAPEHLEIVCAARTTTQLVRSIHSAGAFLLGGYSPTAVADFTAGPSHVLPTGGAGRFSSGLRVTDFMRRTSVVGYERASLARAWPTVEAFGAMERLPAHAASVALRLAQPPGGPRTARRSRRRRR